MPILDKTEIAKEKRKQRRLEALGGSNPKCGICGMANWRCLELHHISDHDRDETKVPVCRNCHRVLSDEQKDHPTFNPANDTMLDAIGHLLLGVVDMLKLIIEKLSAFGHALIERAAPVIERDGK